MQKKPTITIDEEVFEGLHKTIGAHRRIRPYDIRHRFVTEALEGGADMKALSEIVGSSPKTLMKHYQHVTLELHRQTVAKIPPISLNKTEKKIKKNRHKKS